MAGCVSLTGRNIVTHIPNDPFLCTYVQRNMFANRENLMDVWVKVNSICKFTSCTSKKPCKIIVNITNQALIFYKPPESK